MFVINEVKYLQSVSERRRSLDSAKTQDKSGLTSSYSLDFEYEKGKKFQSRDGKNKELTDKYLYLQKI